MIGLVAVTKAGKTAAKRLATAWPGDARHYDESAGTALPKAFAECDAIVCFLAVGATVRLIAPLLRGKGRDPGVVCVDEALRYAVPVLGAHSSGNELARRVGDVLGAEPVITTASDAAGSAALDEFGGLLGHVVIHLVGKPERRLEAKDMFIEQYLTDPLTTNEDHLVVNVYVLVK